MLLLPTSWPGCAVKRMSEPFSRLVMFLGIMHFFFNISEQMVKWNCSVEIFLSYFVALWFNLFSPKTNILFNFMIFLYMLMWCVFKAIVGDAFPRFI